MNKYIPDGDGIINGDKLPELITGIGGGTSNIGAGSGDIDPSWKPDPTEP